MKHSIFSKALSTILVVCMLFSMLALPLSVSALAAGTEAQVLSVSTMQNPNTEDGVVLTKTATTLSDGTVDLTIDAYTTGRVTTGEKVVPADIVLLLDVSGSMDDDGEIVATHTSITEAYADASWFFVNYYTMADGTYYIKINDNYTRVYSAGNDNNRVEYFYYTTGTGNSTQRHYVYPIVEGNQNPTREYNYDVVQFYRETTTTVTHTKMDILKDAVTQFIQRVEAENALVGNQADMHRIAIVKYADDSYYGGSMSLTEGNNKNSSGYNYTQVSKNLTYVDDSGADSLIAAIDALSSGGATAIDYGINLAEYLIENRIGAENRNVVLIAFTDGEPNHSNGYDSSVAASAVQTASNLKSEGVKIFSISVADGADADTLGNQSNSFMHYLSNNYPNATGSGNTITPGEGSPTNGYYFTPDNTHNLDSIFTGIANNIGSPDITLGSQATVVDTISDYFDIEIDAGIAQISVMTATANSDGSWNAPVTESGVSYRLSSDGKTVSVTGFDFDSNFVSKTVRDGNFYGKKLVISIKLVPDYTAIDSMPTVQEYFPTNKGTAKIYDTTGLEAAHTDSPIVGARKIIYKVDGADYKTFSRLVGTEGITVIDPPVKEGHKFSGWSTSDTGIDITAPFTMPDRDIVIEGNFTANTYKVTYRYSGFVPSDATALPTSSNVVFGQKHQTAPNATASGYVFYGWISAYDDVVVANGEFTMPAHDVELYGYFEAGENTPYHIEHYLEQTDGSYKLEERVGKMGETNTTVDIVENKYEGFVADRTHADNVLSGTINGDGSLVLRMHYTRNKFSVTYVIEGTVPTGAVAPAKQDNVYFESIVKVADDLYIPGYKFSGWKITNEGIVADANGEFSMPNRDVVISGSFTNALDTPYKVEHYLENADGTYGNGLGDSTPARVNEYEGETGATATANPIPVTRYILNNSHSSTVATATIAADGSTVLKLYYDRREFKVTYIIDGFVPAGVTVPAEALYTYGGSVTVESPLSVAGYDFVGWYNDAETTDANYVAITSGATFTMPPADVVIAGYFTRSTDTEYKVEHYFENLDGTYGNGLGSLTPERTENFKGETDASVTANPIPATGFKVNYSHPSTQKEGNITSDGKLVLKLYYDREEYTVSYIINGFKPSDASLPAEATYQYGETVTVAGNITAVDYTFSGWKNNAEASNPNYVAISSGATFTMPAADVVISGIFTVLPDVKYEVRHYLENLDGTYGDGNGTANYAMLEEFYSKEGRTVAANAIPFKGFTLDTAHPDTVVSDVIPASGTLVLKLYYSRNKYNVTYAYTGNIPTDATALPNNGQKIEVVYGDTHTLASASTAYGYTFYGWTSQTVGFAITGNSFEMPAHDVIVSGHFHKNVETPYVVNHWIQDRLGKYTAIPYETETRHAPHTTEAVVYAKHYAGFSFDEDTTVGEVKDANGIVSIKKTVASDGATVFDFYYKRDVYTVTYTYRGAVPTGAPALPNAGNAINVYAGAYHTVADNAELAGYDFSGWNVRDNVATVTDGSFKMPLTNVVLEGTFNARNDTPYVVKYFFEGIDGQYAENESMRLNKVGMTNSVVTADIPSVTGFIPKADNVTSGKVTFDPTLVINIYYDRAKFDVTYHIIGEIPAGAQIPATYNKDDVKFGTTVNIEKDLALDGYVFKSWRSLQVDLTSGSFAMPANNVSIYGRFVKLYSVKYDLNGGSANSGTAYDDVTVESGTEITVKDAPYRGGYTFIGWTESDEDYLVGDKVNVERDYTFKANWRKNGGNVVYPEIAKYTLTYDSNGGTEYLSEKYVEDAIAKVDKTPEKHGYVFEGWFFDEEFKLPVENSRVVMDKDVTVYAQWIEDKVPEALDGEHHFAYIVGYGDQTVRPDAHITRAETAAIFFRLLKEEVREKNLSSESKFDDVKSNDWFNINVATLEKLGVLIAREGNSFAPNEAITRGEFADICARFDEDPYVVVDHFSDVSGHKFEDQIHEAAAHGWIGGYEDGTFRPDELITRAEAMKMINRVLNRELSSIEGLIDEGMVTWTDNMDTAAWYYLDIQEATNNHKFILKDDKYEEWTELTSGTDWLKFQ